MSDGRMTDDELGRIWKVAALVIGVLSHPFLGRSEETHEELQSG